MRSRIPSSGLPMTGEPFLLAVFRVTHRIFSSFGKDALKWKEPSTLDILYRGGMNQMGFYVIALVVLQFFSYVQQNPPLIFVSQTPYQYQTPSDPRAVEIFPPPLPPLD
jgi:hypothetical protein